MSLEQTIRQHILTLRDEQTALIFSEPTESADKRLAELSKALESAAADLQRIALNANAITVGRYGNV